MTSRFSRIVAIAVFAVAMCGATVATNQAPPTRIFVSYKMDPRLATGSYGGSDRWVSPQMYTQVGEGNRCKVIVKASGLEAGAPTTIQPKWTSTDPGMVSITPKEGSEVTLIVQRAGLSVVHIESHGVSKNLQIKAAYHNNVLQVEITSK